MYEFFFIDLDVKSCSLPLTGIFNHEMCIVDRNVAVAFFVGLFQFRLFG